MRTSRRTFGRVALPALLATSLLAACGSTYLLDYCDQLFDAAERYRLLGLSAVGQRIDADEEHRAIMTAAIERNADVAAALLSEHVLVGVEMVRKAMTRDRQRKAAGTRSTGSVGRR